MKSPEIQYFQASRQAGSPRPSAARLRGSRSGQASAGRDIFGRSTQLIAPVGHIGRTRMAMFATQLCFILLFALLCQSVAAQQAPPQPKSTQEGIKRSLMWTVIPAALGGGLIIKGAETYDGGDALIVAGIGIGALGLLFGPGAGHVYAHRPHPMSGVWFRALGATVVGLGVLGAAFSASFGHDATGSIVVSSCMGGSVIMTSAIYDIATVSRSVGNYNMLHGLGSVSVTPTFFPRQNALGVSFSLKL